MFKLENIIRKNVLALKPYSSARDEYKGKDAIFLDANESPIETLYNRYPDPQQIVLKEKIALLKKVDLNNIFLGNGSDEAIDLIIRISCNPRKDNIISIDPSYGMYQVSANVNDVEFRKVLLKPDYQLDVDAILNAVDENTKLIFICSPNNPTANCMHREDVIKIITSFDGLVVVDEAYIDFTEKQSFLNDILIYPNLIVMQTFSKAWGLAGARLGLAYAQKEIIDILNKIKPPYNINTVTQKIAAEEINRFDEHWQAIQEIMKQKAIIVDRLSKTPVVKTVFPTDANFILIKVDDPKKIYNYLVSKGIVVRDRSSQSLCEGCLRITVGTNEDNNALMNALNDYKD